MLLFICSVWIFRTEYGGTVLLQIMDEFGSVVNSEPACRVQAAAGVKSRTVDSTRETSAGGMKCTAACPAGGASWL